MNNLFALAARCLHTDNIEEKLEITKQAGELQHLDKLDFNNCVDAASISHTVFPARPKWVEPRDLPRRKLSTLPGKIAFIHSIAHIEFMAIHLAWDILYRFRGMPKEFYLDWLKVAVEEALHFSLLVNLLFDLDCDYGELSAHGGLWQVAEDTEHDLLARLALVPRYMEARGLDVTPGMIHKFEALGEDKVVTVLKRILTDEVGHVAIGSRWFKLICTQRNLEPEHAFFELLDRYLHGNIRGPFDRELRKSAGFSDTELNRLQNYCDNKA